MQNKSLLKAVYGTSGVLEGLVTLVKCCGASAADVMWYLTHIVGIGLPLPVALALRALILTTSGHSLIDSIKKVCPALYRKIQRA